MPPMQTLFAAPVGSLEVAPQNNHPSTPPLARVAVVRLLNNQAACRTRRSAGADQ